MNKPDDFDLVPRSRGASGSSGNAAPQIDGADAGTSGSGGGDEPPEWEPQEGKDSSRGGWLLIAAIAGVALLAFGIGAALFTMRDRLQDAATPTAAVSLVTPAATLATTLQPGWLETLVAAATLSATTPGPGGTPLITSTVTATTTGTPTSSPLVTRVATPTPCVTGATSSFAGAWQPSIFGCASGGSQVVWAAWEPFEQGALLWRSDTNKSYVFTNTGLWQEINAGWDGSSTASRGEAPPGRYAPERGFGWVWATSDPIFNALGWGTDIEKGFCAEVQNFESGFFLQSVPVDSCTAEGLYNQATAGDWRPLYFGAHESGVWSGSLGATTVASAPAPTSLPLSSETQRPEEHGRFVAINSNAIVVDGDLGEWPTDGWLPIANVVQGEGEQRGPRDAFGTFQSAWNNQGLIVAVVVQDDKFRPGPAGTDMWQGDGIEIQFDARLAEDFSDTSANADDFQLGAGFLEDGQGLQMFRWLPLGSDGALPVIGAGSQQRDGYVMELMIPWGYLGMTTPSAGSTFGYNVSVVDNDSRQDRQEVVLSASPARATYNDPTQWGTLELKP